jgi:uncharacterized membrane protein
MEQFRPARDHNPDPARVVEKNIRTLLEVRRQLEAQRSRRDRIPDAITAFSGGMGLDSMHVVWFGGRIAANLGLFGLLTMIVSLEAIFLATFVLLRQNRQAEAVDPSADRDLQINLLSEHETTCILTLVDAIADHHGLEAGRSPEPDEFKKDVKADPAIQEMEDREKELHLDDDFEPR